MIQKTFLLAGLTALTALGAQAQFISEVSANPPGNDRNGGLQYFEITGAPNASLKDNVWLLAIDCGPTLNPGPITGANLGELQIAIPLHEIGNPLQPLKFGANGVLLLRDGGLVTNGVPANPIVRTSRNGQAVGPDTQTNVVTYNVPFVSSGLTYAGFPSPSNFGDVPNDALTLMLVRGGNWAGVPDVDLNDDGVMDAGLLTGVQVLDAMAYKADGTTAPPENLNSQADYAAPVGGFSFGLFQGDRTWEPDQISRVLNASVGGPAVGESYDTRGWILGDANVSQTGVNNSPLLWDEDADEVWFFTDPRGLENNPFGRPMNYAIATPDFPNQTESARPSPGWLNTTVTGPTRRLSGRITLEGWTSALPSTLPIELRFAGMDATQTVNATVATDGTFQVDVPLGVYDVAIQPRSFLARVRPADTRAASVSGLDLTFLPGDIDGDNAVTVFDYDVLSANFDKTSADADWTTPGPDGIAPVAADLDGDGSVTVFDYDLLSANFDQIGE